MMTSLDTTQVILVREVEDAALVREISLLFAASGRTSKQLYKTVPILQELMHQLKRELRHDQ